MKKITSVLLSLCLITGICFSPVPASAKTVNEGIITVSSVSAVVGDSVVIPIAISENPGIMAVTVSITYDSEMLEYVDYYFGEVLTNYLVADHPDRNIIRFVNCQKFDKTGNGVLLSLEFKIKDDAEAGFTPISLEYSAGDFCNYNLDKIMPEIISGGVDIAYNGTNCKHRSYGEWTVAAKPSCEEKGAEQRICKTCGHIELRDIDPIGHKYADTWTVDRVATAEQDGIMTRYCIRCEDYADRISFSLKQSEEGSFGNEINAEVPLNDFTEGLFKEQYPDRELTNSKAPSDVSQKNDDTVSDGAFSESSITDSYGDENENGPNDSSSVYQKAKDVLPKLDLILKYFKAALIVLGIAVL